MITALTVGVLALLATAVAGVAWRRAPTRLACPECASDTSAVRPPGLLRRATLVRWRWCQECGWEGVGRSGPEWLPGRQVAHDSGFHWGDERLPEDFGFRWARRPDTGPPATPHHPSGFRFANGGRTERPHHPSGFRFASDDDDAPAHHPSGFRFASDAPDAGTSAARDGGADLDERAGAERGHPSGFRWGAVPEDAPTFTWAPPRAKKRRGGHTT